jgi:hypothetical protein
MSDADRKKLEKPTGQVRHDPGGRAVWQWAIDSGKHAIESTSRLLKKLDLSHLSILDYDEKKQLEQEAREREAREQTRPREIPTFGGKRETDPLAGGRQGFNPYDSRTPVGRSAMPAKPKGPPKPRITQPVRPAKKPGLFSRLFGADKR